MTGTGRQWDWSVEGWTSGCSVDVSKTDKRPGGLYETNSGALAIDQRISQVAGSKQSMKSTAD